MENDGKCEVILSFGVVMFVGRFSDIEGEEMVYLVLDLEGVP